MVAPQLKEAGRTIAAAAKDVGAPTFVYGRDWTVSATESGLRYRSEWVDLTLPAPGLLGRHQLINAGTAVACLEQLEGLEITDTAISEGLPAAQWPGRMQPMTGGPLADLLPAGWELWLDGGHNMAAAAALAETVAQWDDMPLYLIFAMMDGKSPADFLQPLAPTVQGLCAVAIPGHDGSLSAADCADAAVAAGIPSHTAEDVEGGIQDILQRGAGTGAHPDLRLALSRRRRARPKHRDRTDLHRRIAGRNKPRREGGARILAKTGSGRQITDSTHSTS